MELIAIKKIENKDTKPVSKRVCAYARVSNGKDEMLHSLACQVSHYASYIQEHDDWIYCGVFADEAISGTKNNRAQFQAMLKLARDGGLDMIITKSISRFARNTLTLLNTVRELKDLNVDVYFEEQNIHSISKEGELMLTILATYAQEEARAVSENVLWRVRKNFEKGIVYSKTILGYRIKDSVLVIEESEAEIVQEIFDLYLSGLGPNKVADKLNKKGYLTRFGNKFTGSTISGILRNETYTGELILQKTFRKDYLSKKTLKNNGERTMYRVENAHEAIISKEIFQKVQEEIKRRRALAPSKSFSKRVTPFRMMLVCEHCGRHLISNKCRDVYSWRCTTYDKFGKDACPSKKVPEEALIKACNEVLNITDFNEEYFKKKIDHIVVRDNNILTFVFKNGSSKDIQWKDKSRSSSWTPLMKEMARQRTLLRMKGTMYGSRKEDNYYTSKN